MTEIDSKKQILMDVIEMYGCLVFIAVLVLLCLFQL